MNKVREKCHFHQRAHLIKHTPNSPVAIDRQAFVNAIVNSQAGPFVLSRVKEYVSPDILKLVENRERSRARLANSLREALEMLQAEL